MSTVRIMVVDDFEDWRRFLLSQIQQIPTLLVICEVSDGLESVRKAEELKPDLILLDVSLPNMNGVEAARQIRLRAPNSKILFVSQESDLDVVQESLRLGALGYLLKRDAGEELLAAVDSVVRGKPFLSRGVAQSQIRSRTQRASFAGPELVYGEADE